jgi:hypothetical protein|tara:strand:- start:320 stop:508 length:189 start_codon:yes stop_codon:yes gene_type:complete
MAGKSAQVGIMISKEALEGIMITLLDLLDQLVFHIDPKGTWVGSNLGANSLWRIRFVSIWAE